MIIYLFILCFVFVFLQFRIIALWFDFLPLHQILIENDEKTYSMRTKLFLLIFIKGTKVNWTINFEKCCNLERRIIWVGEASHRFPIHHQRLHHIRLKQNSTSTFFFPLKFLTYEVFLLVLCLPYQFPLNHPSQQKDLGVWMVIISKPHISVSSFLYTSAVKGSDLWDAKLAQTLWSSAKNSHGAVQPNHYSNITQKFSIIHRRVRPQFQIKCLHGLWVYSNI